jgi:hypothetical protein
VHGADAGQQQRGHLGVLHHASHGLDPLQVGVRAKAVVEAAALQAVAVGDLDGVDAGLVQRLAICRAWATLYWWRMAWLPSRRVTSEM